MFEKLLSLPIEKKIGQLFFIGISGVDLIGDAHTLLSEIAPGGICLFSRNIKTAAQVRNLLDQIRSSSTVEPFLSVDQEGGVVDRLRRVLTPMPAAAFIKTVADAERAARITSEALRLLGFNMNFAPVVDVAGEKRGSSSNGLYSRSFGETSVVVECGGAYLRVLQENGCVGCLKHFPGLGASKVDSHEDLPLLRVSENEFREVDLSPFREIIKQKQALALMTAHAAFPDSEWQESGADGGFLPASLSYNFTTRLLRDRLNFAGVAITDDLEMGAIVKHYGVGDACRLAIGAGADMLAICADPNAVRAGFDAVRRAVESGEISEKRIDESLRRIAHLKSILRPPLSFDEARLAALSTEITEFNKKLNYSYGG